MAGSKHRLDVLGSLLPLEWRGIRVPVANLSTTGGNRTVVHEQPNVPGAITESTGRRPIVTRATVLLRAGVFGFGDMYPSRYQDFIEALIDPSTGPLQHPQYGEMECRVHGDWTANWAADKRDGCDLEVAWIEHSEDKGFENADMIMDAFGLPGEADAEVRRIFEEDNSISGANLLEGLSALKGQLERAELSVADAVQKIANAMNTISEMIEFLESATDPNTWETSRSLKATFAALQRLAENLTPPGKMKRIAMKIAEATRPASAYAARWKMSAQDFFSLNPSAALTGKVEAGQEFFVYE